MPWSTAPPSIPSRSSRSPASAPVAPWSSTFATPAPASATKPSTTLQESTPTIPRRTSVFAKKKACAPEVSVSSSPPAQSTNSSTTRSATKSSSSNTSTPPPNRKRQNRESNLFAAAEPVFYRRFGHTHIWLRVCCPRDKAIGANQQGTQTLVVLGLRRYILQVPVPTSTQRTESLTLFQVEE